jgi:hypothetical protein
MACGRPAAKKLPTAPVGRTGSRAAEANGPIRALAHRVNCVSRLRGLSSSIQILAFRRLIHFEAGLRADPQLPCERPAPPTRRPLTVGERIVNNAYPFVKKDVDFLITPELVGSAIGAFSAALILRAMRRSLHRRVATVSLAFT